MITLVRILMLVLIALPIVVGIVIFVEVRRLEAQRQAEVERWQRINSGLVDAKIAVEQMKIAHNRGDYEASDMHSARAREIIEHVQALQKNG